MGPVKGTSIHMVPLSEACQLVPMALRSGKAKSHLEVSLQITIIFINEDFIFVICDSKITAIIWITVQSKILEKEEEKSTECPSDVHGSKN